MSVTLADHGDNRSTLRYQMDPANTADFTAALANAGALITDLDALTDAVIVGYKVEEEYYNDAIALPAGGVENEDKASVTFSIDGTNKKGNFKIPAPINTVGVVFVGTSGASANQVATTSTQIQNYADNFRTAGGFLISDGEKLNQVLVGKRISSKSNNG
jgi:hypothetical protein